MISRKMTIEKRRLQIINLTQKTVKQYLEI